MEPRKEDVGARPVERAGREAYLWTVALVGIATAAGALLRGHMAAPDQVMLYLLVIGIAAGRFGRRCSLVASSLSVLTYDFFFVPPFYTFTVEEDRHLLTFAMMFAVGLAISELTRRIRRSTASAEAAVLRARTEEIRSSLLSAVSHDLRTPLAAITGAATTLRRASTGVDSHQREELLDTICEEAERLERLVRNLLDMTRLQFGALEVKREWVTLEEVVGSALTRVEPLLAGRPIHTDLPFDLPLVSADPVLLEQVFVNLLENASKYTQSGTPVEIAARADASGVIIEVSDHGPGLPRGAETAVFDKFYRGAAGTRPGVGLGLAICRGIVAAHGGRLTATNRDHGGATFQIRLPQVGTAPAVPAEVVPEGVP